MFIGIKDRVLMEQEKTRLEAQDACLRDEMRAQLNFGDIIGELRSLKMLQQFQRLTPTESGCPAVLCQGKANGP